MQTHEISLHDAPQVFGDAVNKLKDGKETVKKSLCLYINEFPYRPSDLAPSVIGAREIILNLRGTLAVIYGDARFADPIAAASRLISRLYVRICYRCQTQVLWP